MSPTEAQVLLPRFVNAVIAMAASTERSLRRRLAYSIDGVLVFHEDRIPNQLKTQYRELRSLLAEAHVPEGAANHPDFPKSTRAYYLSAKDASRVAFLVTSMFETLVYASYAGVDDDDLTRARDGRQP